MLITVSTESRVLPGDSALEEYRAGNRPRLSSITSNSSTSENGDTPSRQASSSQQPFQSERLGVAPIAGRKRSPSAPVRPGSSESLYASHHKAFSNARLPITQMPQRPQLLMPTIEASPNIPQARLMPEFLSTSPANQSDSSRARSAEPLGAAERQLSAEESHQGAVEALARLCTVSCSP